MANSFVLYTNCVSPHQLPLAQEIVHRIGEANYRYLYTEELEAQRSQMGWHRECNQEWCRHGDETSKELLEYDVLFSELRVPEVFARRLSEGRLTCYVSERWFKPPKGAWRLLSPAYWKMARQFVNFLDSPNFYYFPQGIHAARDMMRIQGIVHGDARCLFQAPKVAFEARPGGCIIPLKQAIYCGVLNNEEIAWGRQYGFVRISPEHWGRIETYAPWRNYRLWGYFVAPGTERHSGDEQSQRKKVLWAGRMLDWKRVPTLVDAIPDDMELELYGHGPDEANIRRHAAGKTNVHFHDFVPIEQMRALMHQHDIYVLPSDGGEGWGAVVNEALEEGMPILSTLESGAGATMLELEQLFQAGNVASLHKKLKGVSQMKRSAIGGWSAAAAAEYLCAFIAKHPAP